MRGPSPRAPVAAGGARTPRRQSPFVQRRPTGGLPIFSLALALCAVVPQEVIPWRAASDAFVAARGRPLGAPTRQRGRQRGRHHVTLGAALAQAEAAAAATGTGAGPQKTVIIGGGPAGLTTAIALALRGWRGIQVYDRLAEPPDPDDDAAWSDTARFYLIGLGGRGQEALRALGVWDDVAGYATAIRGRKDWPPGAGPDGGVERLATHKPYTTMVLARDRLAGVLLRVLRERFADAVTVRYGVECAGVAWDEAVAKLRLQPCAAPAAPAAAAARQAPEGEAEGCDVDGEPFEEATPFLIGADGVARSVADAMEADDKSKGGFWAPWQRFRVTRYKDDNVRVYKTVPMKLPKDWRGDINYSSRSKDGRVNFDALPADGDGNYCGVLLLREGDPLAHPDTAPEELRELFDTVMPQFSALVTDEVIEAVARKPPSRLPSFRFAGPRLHHRGSTVLLGDAIHTVKPYFGLGANSALQDVSVLAEALDAAGDDVPAAVRGFSEARAGEAEALVRISRGLDRPGTLGFLTFVLPLILDSICHKLAPRIFGPNVLALLQQEGVTFRGAAWRKRKDRALQIAVLGAAATGTSLAAAAAVRLVASGLRRVVPPAALVGAASGLAVAVAVAAAARRGAAKTRHMAPADVMPAERGTGAAARERQAA